jgi:FMN phosphatase YigB (HAD superfamily)
MNKIILTDADGVLLDWNKGFEAFALSKGHPKVPGTDDDYRMYIRHNISADLAHNLIKEFNEGPDVEHLEPFSDSVEYVGKLAKLGFRFIVVTSISSHPDSKIYRTRNLNKHFGDVFDEIMCLEMGASKASALMRWAGTSYFWIEDHMRQAEAGYEAGLSPLLINHPYNHHYETDLFPKISFEKPWKQVYGAVLNRYY